MQRQRQENYLQYAEDWFNINKVASETQTNIVVLRPGTDSHLNRDKSGSGRSGR